MAKEKMDLQGLAHELDSASGNLACHVEVLEDIKTNFMHIVEDMNNLSNPEDLKIHFREWHRELRILSQLMHHVMEETEETQQNVKYLSEGFFDEIVRGGSGE